MKRLIAALGASAALWALAACGGIEETAGADGASSGSNDIVAGALSPEDMSTGPILQWTELDPAIDGPGALFSIGDGRVMIRGETPAGASQFLSTSDGSNWSVVQLPASLSPDAFHLTGARWVVAGWSHHDLGEADFSGRIYVSDDLGAIWTDVTPQTDSSDLPEFAIAHTKVHAVAASGAQVVALASTHLNLDIEALLTDRGLLPAGAQVHGSSVGGGQVDVWLYEESSETDSHLQGPQWASETALTFTVDELDLSAEQLAIMESPISGESIGVYAGAGSELAEVLRFDGWRASAIGHDDGFVLLTQTSRDEVRRLTSPDGENWTTQTLDPSLVPGWVGSTALGPDGTVWIASFDGAESHLTKWGAGAADLTTTRLGRVSSSGDFSVGPGGLAMLAFPSRPDPPAGTSDDAGLPIGRVAKDGYELRYGEPEGGVSLWDIVADEPVYEFGPEPIQSDEPPARIRGVDDGDVFELTFEDPVTGAELVTFTREDLEAVLGVQPDSSDWPDTDIWVGWSSDGTEWGWQNAREALDLGDVEAHVVVAVGSDFVIAQVWAFTPVEAGNPESRAANGRDTVFETELSIERSAGTMKQRWFIARVP